MRLVYLLRLTPKEIALIVELLVANGHKRLANKILKQASE